jgi:hypothetical protein
MTAGSVCITEKQKSYYSNYDRIFRFSNWSYEVIKGFGNGVIKTVDGDVYIQERTVYVSDDVNFGAI